MKKQRINIALLGHGTVGQSVRRIILEHHDRLREIIKDRTGHWVDIKIIGILVSDVKKHSALEQDLYTVPEELLQQDYDVLIELMGGHEPATGLMERALMDGKDVVTANKHALFTSQGRLEERARINHVSLSYEAAVAGAIPILHSVRSLVSGEITHIEGILNGSTNYVLTQVARGVTLQGALDEASAKGFLETDPSSDLEGYDAMYKLGILSYLATGEYPLEEDIERVGITGLTEETIALAKEENKKIKLIASANLREKKYSVKPVLITKDHYLYQVDGALNGITLQHEHAGELSFRGAGAGGDETASAVIGNLIDVICNRLRRCEHD